MNILRRLRPRLFDEYRYLSLTLLAVAWTLSASVAFGQGTTFTYQGRLTDGGTPANGSYDFQFTLWDSAIAGTQIPAPNFSITKSNVPVVNGVFTTELNFGPNFPGAARYLEIRVRSGQDPLTVLSPRQPITSTPYAVRSLSAASADTASSADTVLVSGVPSGSGNYIQNTAAPQAASNFNISGNGTAGGTLSANIVRATSQYNIGIDRVLSTAGEHNLFVGTFAGGQNIGRRNAFFGSSAGNANTSGGDNSFFGYSAGHQNMTGEGNSFFGTFAGSANTANNNSFFGSDAGQANTTGTRNSFFGLEAGTNNTTSNDNSFFGYLAGAQNTTGDSNAFFGSFAGRENTTGLANAFFGAHTGDLNTTGSRNTFVGELAGSTNTDGGNNTYIGSAARGSASLNNATAIGSRANVTQSNSLVLGSIDGVNAATASTNVGIGTTAPANRLHVRATFNSPATPVNHVALIENDSTGNSPDVLALKIGRTTNPEAANNFITFFNGNDLSVGSIEGNGAGGVVLAGAGNDYAEWLPRLDPTETIQPGDVVGVFDGRISKATRRASQVMVVSSSPIVAGNDPGVNQRAAHSLVAFIGQAIVRVRGEVRAGDLIVPSGDGDGLAIAISPERITAEQFAQLVGQAWETSANPAVKRVRVAVGLMRNDPTVKRLLEQNQNQAAQIGLLQARMSALDARLAASERKMQTIAARRSQRPAISKLSR